MKRIEESAKMTAYGDFEVHLFNFSTGSISEEYGFHIDTFGIYASRGFMETYFSLEAYFWGKSFYLINMFVLK